MTIQETIKQLNILLSRERYLLGCSSDEQQRSQMIEALEVAKEAVEKSDVKHGEWIEHPHFNFEGGYSGADYECSRCGYSDCVYEEYNYCPNCGAKMDKE